ncbi:MAG: FtsW/RodA/SpoVE family cell cycle protein [Bacteroidetes bacterium]|nr:FtsW/RodA/SpoVE family cell cycle protein [Bacteroidota bacterium]
MLKSIVENIKGDRYIWMIILALSAISLLAVYSSTRTLAYRYHAGDTEYYLFKHLFILSLGLMMVYLAHRIDYRYYSRIAQLLLIISIPLLFYTIFFGVELNDAKRWITLPIVNLSFQTSDLAKLSLIMYTARTLSKRQGVVDSFQKAFVPVIIPILIVCGLIAPADLSSAAILFMTCLIIMFIGRVNFKYIGATILGGAIVLGIIILIGYAFPGTTRMDTWVSRVNEFLNPDVISYQREQANIAIANGGIFRLAPGKSIQCNFLPHSYSDNIYSTIIEEYGLTGGAFVLFLYLFLLWRVIRIIGKSPRAFGALLAVGLGMSLVIQALIHMGVNVGILPVTGLTLPLVSMGGTSIWFNGIALGIILSVSVHIEEREERMQEAKNNLVTS